MNRITVYVAAVLWLSVGIFSPLAYGAGADGEQELKGDGVVIKLTPDADAPKGTITLNGKTYPFAARPGEDDSLRGTYKVDGKSVPFTLKLEDDETGRVILELQGKRYRLHASGVEGDDGEAPEPAEKETPPKAPVAPREEVPEPDDTGKTSAHAAPKELVDQATKGDTNAMYRLGQIAEQSGDLPEAAKWYEKAGAAEHMDAMAALAILHLRGEGKIKHDPAHARELLDYAAENGGALAKKTLAELKAGKDFRRKQNPLAKKPVAAELPADPDVEPDAEPPQPAQGPAPAVAGTLVLEKHAVHDKQTDLDVFRLLLPKGWTIDSDILWRLDRAQWVTASVQVADPKSRATLRWIPWDQFSANPALLKNARDQGVAPFGMGGLELVERPLNPVEYVQQVALPRHRKIEGAQVTSSAMLPKLAEATARSMQNEIAIYKQGGIEMRIQAGKVRIAYTEDDVEMEEDIYCTLVHSWQPGMNAQAAQLGVPGSSVFYPRELYSYSAPKGRLDAVAPTLQMIANSCRSTPEWDAFVATIQQMRQRAAVRDGQIAAAARQKVSEQQQQAWEQRMASQDRIAEARGDVLSGVQRFVEPADPTTRVILPDAYKRAFADGQGHYIVSNDPLYNPREDQALTGEWNEMSKPER